jgi:hypothetical protein
MEEQYKIITGFSNYEVSNFGNVRNIKTGKILKQNVDGGKYLKLDIVDDSCKRQTKKIHRLVAESFIPNLLNKPSVDHINNDKSNNNVENLRWASNVENGRNRSMHINNTSGIKGIHFIGKRNKWRALIKHNRKLIHLGYFDNKNDAIIARVNKAKEFFGDFINKCEKMPDEIELDELDKELTRLINS